MHIFCYPFNNKLKVTGVTSKPAKVYLLSDKNKTPLPFHHNGPVLTVDLPEDQPDPYIPVVAVEYSGKPETVDGLAAETIEGGFSLTPSNLPVAVSSMKIISKQRSGTIPPHVVLRDKTILKWKIYADEAGIKTFDISYSYQGTKDKNIVVVRAANSSINHTVIPTGKTVGEPNSDWVIDNFKSNRIGTISFPAPGYYEIELEINPAENDEIKFQWLWMK